jgi:hypothetical protein
MKTLKTASYEKMEKEAASLEAPWNAALGTNDKVPAVWQICPACEGNKTTSPEKSPDEIEGMRYENTPSGNTLQKYRSGVLNEPCGECSMGGKSMGMTLVIDYDKAYSMATPKQRQYLEQQESSLGPDEFESEMRSTGPDLGPMGPMGSI